MTHDADIGPGHNKPPAYDPEKHGDLLKKATNAANIGAELVKPGQLDDETAPKANDYLSACVKLRKAIEDARKVDKKPHDDAGREVQAAYAKLTAIVEASEKKVKPLLTAFAAKKEAEAAEKRRIAEAEAERKRKEAEELAAAAASRGDVIGEVEAEEAMKKAEAAAKSAAKISAGGISSATGAAKSRGMRTFREAEITNINQLFVHYRDRPEVAAVLKRLADADIRASGVDETQIPGIKIIEERRVA